MIKEIEEEIEIGQLFKKLNIDKQGEYKAPSSLEIDTPFGWKKVNGLLKTQENPEWEVETEVGKKACFTDLHRLETKTGNLDLKNNLKWGFVKDLKKGDEVKTKDGWEKIKNVYFNGKYSQMYDLQVEDIACFYANNFNSHNTLFLGNIGINAFLEGKKVLFYTFETALTKLMVRLYANLTGYSKSEVIMDEDGATKRLNEVFDSFYEGDLKIKEYGANEVCSGDLIANIKDLSMYEDWIPDLIIVDYILIMLPNDKRISPENSYKFYKATSEDLRNIGKRLRVPILTAAQINREGMSDRGGSLQQLGGKQVSESRGIYDTCDTFMPMAQGLKDKEKNRFYLIGDKVREGESAWRIQYDVDYEHMKITEGAIVS